MENLIIIGDLHYNSKEPRINAMQDFNNWFLNQGFNNENNIALFLGDIFDESKPDPETNELVLKFFSNLKFKKIFIVQGNHEYSGLTKQSANQILTKFNNIEIITNLKKLDVENLHCLCLPYFYPSQNGKNIYDVYNNLSEDFINDKYDYVFGHIEDETQHFGNNFINLSKLKGKRILGHIHIPSDNYLGVPVISRYDERNIDCKIASISFKDKLINYIEVPKLLNYYNVEYPNDLIFEVPYPIFTINNCIKDKGCKEYYINKYKDKKLYFREFKYKEEKEENFIEDDEKVLTEKEMFNNFCQEKKINNEIKKICEGYLK